MQNTHITTTNVNLRDVENINKVIATIPLNTEVKVLRAVAAKFQNHSFVEVICDGKKGLMADAFLKEIHFLKSKVVEIAEKEVGTVESPRNSNMQKYGEWFGFNGVAWCAIFVSWCYHHAGKPLGNIGWAKGFAGCMVGLAHFRKKNQVTDNPVSGSIVFFDWNNDGRFDHVGIFVRWIDKTRFETIEGNTSAQNQSNGGEVQLRNDRKINGRYKVVFVTPDVLI